MSQYVYHCQDCNREFTQQLHISEVARAFDMLDTQADGVVKIVIEQ